MENRTIKTVSLCGDNLLAFRELNKIYVSLKHMCESLGINPDVQRKKCLGDESLKLGIKKMQHIQKGLPPSVLYCMEIDYVLLWLAGINTKKVKSEVKEKLKLYKNQVKDILSKEFFGGYKNYGLSDHLQKEVQIQNSKDVNDYNYKSGTKQIISYNAENCKRITGMYPKEWKNLAKKDRVPAKERTSGKSCVRYYYKDKACTMSFADNLVKQGNDPEDVWDICEKHNISDLYKDMIFKLGVTPSELEQK